MRICFPILLALLIGANHRLSENMPYQARVVAGYAGQPGAKIAGEPTFATIKEALDFIPNTNDLPFKIFIGNGHYYEKIVVTKAHVQFIGESQEQTIITFDASADSPNPTGGTYGTQGCATLIISAPHFRAENLTIENSFDYPTNAAKSDDDPSKVRNPQAVALMTGPGSDCVVFRRCKIVGYQDTIFANSGRHYFAGCRIFGHVDFIFGAGQAVFEECEVVSRNRAGKNPTGYITAPSTLASFPYGFLFLRCHLVKETSELAAGSVRLGRPWHPNANPSASGSAIFMNCYMDDHISAEGYAAISALDSSGSRVWFEIKPDSRFFEFGSYGPGAIQGPKRPVLEPQAVKWYTPDQVLAGWHPETND
ncbi:MAG: pectinesterase family protein [candidate division KSB1 bacterium]|nr:pectinesterase family protein [candidate division KSB1 bacterium]MDZ7317691.1 pectinesterase family protein [candidate division KSB1 bacterium]MDZ7340158.1 pectinesterase family protein [candidate division KSB1 bacterium]